MELLIERSIFSILYKDREKNEIRHVGTGVVVSKKGIFITAGHTFRKKGDFELGDFRACFIVEGNIYITPIKNMCWDSIERCEQKSPEFRDYAVGQLLNPIRVDPPCKGLYIKKYVYLKLRKKKPSEMEKLNLYTYEYKSPKSKDKSLGVDFNNLNINKIHLISSELLVIKNETVIENKIIRTFNVFNNCSSLRGEAKNTNSGAPICDKDKSICGLVLGQVDGVQGKDADNKFVNMCRSRYYANKLKRYIYFRNKCENYQRIDENRE